MRAKQRVSRLLKGLALPLYTPIQIPCPLPVLAKAMRGCVREWAAALQYEPLVIMWIRLHIRIVVRKPRQFLDSCKIAHAIDMPSAFLVQNRWGVAVRRPLNDFCQ
eukprot:15471413-Alexandrium_andersonii.AAC.1